MAGPAAYDIDLLLYQPHPFAAGPTSDYATARLPQNQLYPPARMPPASTTRYPPRSASARSASDVRGPVSAPLPQTAQRWGYGHTPLISEIRGGLLIHDLGPFGSSEEDGTDVNLEILFASPDFLGWAWSPRPHVGADINLSGDTSQVYFGLTWEWSFWRGWFAGFSLGGAVHDGELKTNQIDRKELGCRLLFRESIEGGYRFNGRHSVSLFLDHISNASICSKNEGLDNLGLRYGYRF